MATKFQDIVRAIKEGDGIFLLRRGKKSFGYGLLFEVSPYMYADTSVENGFYSIIERLPEDSILQVFMWADDDIEDMLSLIKKGEGLPGRLFEERYEYYVKSAKEGGFYGIHPIRDFKLYIAFYIPIDISKSAEEIIEEAESLKNSIIQTFEAMKMAHRVMAFEDYSELLDKILLGRRVGSGATDVSGLVARNFEAVEEKSVVRIKGGREFSVLSPFFLPNRFHITMMSRLLGAENIEEVTKNLTKPFFISAILRKKPINEVKGLATKGYLIERQASGFAGNIAPILKEASRDFAILRDRRNKGEKVVDFWLFAGAHPSEIEKMGSLFTNIAQVEGFGVSSFKVFIEEQPGPVLEDFFYSLPFMFPWEEPSALDKLPSFFTMRTMKEKYTAWNRHFHLLGRDAVKFMPLMGDLKGNFAKEGDYPPALCFISPKGQVMYVDIFNSGAGYNFLIVASTGSGKSVLGNEIINGYRQGYRHRRLL